MYCVLKGQNIIFFKFNLIDTISKYDISMLIEIEGSITVAKIPGRIIQKI